MLKHWLWITCFLVPFSLPAGNFCTIDGEPTSLNKSFEEDYFYDKSAEAFKADTTIAGFTLPETVSTAVSSAMKTSQEVVTALNGAAETTVTVVKTGIAALQPVIDVLKPALEVAVPVLDIAMVAFWVDHMWNVFSDNHADALQKWASVASILPGASELLNNIDYDVKAKHSEQEWAARRTYDAKLTKGQYYDYQQDITDWVDDNPRWGVLRKAIDTHKSNICNLARRTKQHITNLQHYHYLMLDEKAIALHSTYQSMTHRSTALLDAQFANMDAIQQYQASNLLAVGFFPRQESAFQTLTDEADDLSGMSRKNYVMQHIPRANRNYRKSLMRVINRLKQDWTLSQSFADYETSLRTLYAQKQTMVTNTMDNIATEKQTLFDTLNQTMKDGVDDLYTNDATLASLKSSLQTLSKRLYLLENNANPDTGKSEDCYEKHKVSGWIRYTWGLTVPGWFTVWGKKQVCADDPTPFQQSHNRLLVSIGRDPDAIQIPSYCSNYASESLVTVPRRSKLDTAIVSKSANAQMDVSLLSDDDLRDELVSLSSSKRLRVKADTSINDNKLRFVPNEMNLFQQKPPLGAYMQFKGTLSAGDTLVVYTKQGSEIVLHYKTNQVPQHGMFIPSDDFFVSVFRANSQSKSAINLSTYWLGDELVKTAQNMIVDFDESGQPYPQALNSVDGIRVLYHHVRKNISTAPEHTQQRLNKLFYYVKRYYAPESLINAVSTMLKGESLSRSQNAVYGVLDLSSIQDQLMSLPNAPYSDILRSDLTQDEIAQIYGPWIQSFIQKRSGVFYEMMVMNQLLKEEGLEKTLPEHYLAFNSSDAESAMNSQNGTHYFAEQMNETFALLKDLDVSRLRSGDGSNFARMNQFQQQAFLGYFDAKAKELKQRGLPFLANEIHKMRQEMMDVSKLENDLVVSIK